jgi:hypothetical protein
MFKVFNRGVARGYAELEPTSSCKRYSLGSYSVCWTKNVEETCTEKAEMVGKEEGKYKNEGRKWTVI